MRERERGIYVALAKCNTVCLVKRGADKKRERQKQREYISNAC